MSYTKITRVIIPTPATASQELEDTIVKALTQHYTKPLPTALLIASRKSCYSLIINTTYGKDKLEVVLGTAMAKVATTRVLDNLLAKVSTVKVVTAKAK